MLLFTGRVFDDTSATVTSFLNLDLITSDQYAQAYLDYLFSVKGPVAELENYFIEASDKLRQRTPLGCKNEGGVEAPRLEMENDDRQGKGEIRGRQEEEEECEQRDESLKLSIVETQPQESLNHNLHGATST